MPGVQNGCLEQEGGESHAERGGCDVADHIHFEDDGDSTKMLIIYLYFRQAEAGGLRARRPSVGIY